MIKNEGLNTRILCRHFNVQSVKKILRAFLITEKSSTSSQRGQTSIQRHVTCGAFRLSVKSELVETCLVFLR